MSNRHSLLIAPLLAACIAVAQEPQPAAAPARITVPDGFPKFIVPGSEAEMQSLRELFFLHYSSARLCSLFNAHWMGEGLLWPAFTDATVLNQRAWTAQRLLNARIMPDGYVSCEQHEGLGHPEGWPYPIYAQNGGVGWQFIPHLVPVIAIPPAQLDEFRLAGCTTLVHDTVNGWRLRITAPRAAFVFPPMSVQGVVGSFFLLKWAVTNAPAEAQCRLAFRTAAHPQFSREQSVLVPLPNATSGLVYTWIALLGHPRWNTNDTLTGLRLVFERAAGADVTLAHACTAVDTRHNVNNALLIDTCHSYALWSGDTNFLAQILPRLRYALQYALREFAVRSNACVLTPWLGHDGTSGISYDTHGNKIIRCGYGIPNNYFDLLPFGGRDAYATLYLFGALRKMAELEDAAAQHPEWGLPPPAPDMTPLALRELAHLLAVNNTQFWNNATGRFGTLDLNRRMYDYGFVQLNCEAVYYGFANPRQAQSIMQWLEGSRIVADDTSRGTDIYHWVFAPRVTTRRNIDYYTHGWGSPEDIPFGHQIQDGGAVLGFSFHDIMLRLATRGPDNAWERLRVIADWFARVQAGGGYRNFYANQEHGTLQGGGTVGGLGFDYEFYESVLVPQALIYGFMGVRPRMDGLVVRPRLPRAFPSLTITDILFQDTTLTLSASNNVITATIQRGPGNLNLYLPDGLWQISYETDTGVTCARDSVTIFRAQPAVPLRQHTSVRVVCRRRDRPRTAP